jgi:hypothetical protein
MQPGQKLKEAKESACELGNNSVSSSSASFFVNDSKIKAQNQEALVDKIFEETVKELVGKEEKGEKSEWADWVRTQRLYCTYAEINKSSDFKPVVDMNQVSEKATLEVDLPPGTATKVSGSGKYSKFVIDRDTYEGQIGFGYLLKKTLLWDGI